MVYTTPFFLLFIYDITILGQSSVKHSISSVEHGAQDVAMMYEQNNKIKYIQWILQ